MRAQRRTKATIVRRVQGTCTATQTAVLACMDPMKHCESQCDHAQVSQPALCLSHPWHEALRPGTPSSFTPYLIVDTLSSVRTRGPAGAAMWREGAKAHQSSRGCRALSSAQPREVYADGTQNVEFTVSAAVGTLYRARCASKRLRVDLRPEETSGRFEQSDNWREGLRAAQCTATVWDFCVRSLRHRALSRRGNMGVKDVREIPRPRTRCAHESSAPRRAEKRRQSCVGVLVRLQSACCASTARGSRRASSKPINPSPPALNSRTPPGQPQSTRLLRSGAAHHM